MKKRLHIVPLLALIAALCLLAGCGEKQETKPEDASPTAEQTTGEDTSKVADASQMTTVEDVVDESKTPVRASELTDGVYEIAVDCSSSMFRIERCELTVGGDAMIAKLFMSSDSYGYLYPGTAEQAAAADEADYLLPDGQTFVLPVEALDQGVACAAWSRNKELWYDRTLVFRADSLPLEAFASLTTAETLALADGDYTVEVTLAGGSGRASVESPAELTVNGGACTAKIVWGSSNYDYMKVDGEQLLPVNTEGNSTFLIPVAAFDHPLAVIADTTAMSQPHEINYTLLFDSASIQAVAP
ncbi:MAG: hypothetical protein II010_07860 [Oscillospiraceae bacterium]|nr:hypothetical protein [Oscillospiraceae bacterium]